MIRTIPLFAAAASLALVSAVPARAQANVVELDTAVRCSALFAIIASGQDKGNAAARLLPPMEPRGKEVFVQTAARLMDEGHLDRDQTAARFKAEVTSLSGDIAAAPAPAARMQALAAPCLPLLDAVMPAK